MANWFEPAYLHDRGRGGRTRAGDRERGGGERLGKRGEGSRGSRRGREEEEESTRYELPPHRSIRAVNLHSSPNLSGGSQGGGRGVGERKREEEGEWVRGGGRRKESG
eukprot:712211-Hanusia_phi.AAC.2